MLATNLDSCHSYCAGWAAERIGRQNLRLVIGQFGNGASMFVVSDGVCVDTSMGFTPLEGLVMGTRSGTVDPGILVYTLEGKGLDGNALDKVLKYESGLLGLSGILREMRWLTTSFMITHSRGKSAKPL